MSEEGGGAYGLEFGERVREVEHGRPASHGWIREKTHPSGAAVAAAAPLLLPVLGLCCAPQATGTLRGDTLCLTPHCPKERFKNESACYINKRLRSSVSTFYLKCALTSFILFPTGVEVNLEIP